MTKMCRLPKKVLSSNDYATCQFVILELDPLVPMVPLSGLVQNENASVVEFVKNLDAKCEV